MSVPIRKDGKRLQTEVKRERQVKGLTENFWNQDSDSSGEDSTYEADEKQKEKVRESVKIQNRKTIQECELEIDHGLDYYSILEILEKLTGDVWIWSERDGNYYYASTIEEIMFKLKQRHKGIENTSSKFVDEHRTFRLYQQYGTIPECYFMTEGTYEKVQEYLDS